MTMGCGCFGGIRQQAALALKVFASNQGYSAASRSIVQVGHRKYELGSTKLGRMRDSSRLAQQGAWEDLRKRFREDGYVFVRGLLPAASVRTAKMQVLKFLEAQGLLAEGTSIEEGHIGGTHTADQGRLRNADQLCETSEIQQFAQHEALQSFCEGLFGRKAVTYDNKWLRCVNTGESSGFHMDTVYMGKNKTPSLVTCWLPMMEVPAELGGLVVSSGSSSNAGFAAVRDTYGAYDVDDDDISGTGWLTEDPEEVARYGGQLQTDEFQPGDVVLFSMHTMHGSAVNQTRRWRISMDVRWQPEDEFADPRWFFDDAGTIPGMKGRWVLGRNDPKEFPRTMEMAKRDWGLPPNGPE